MGRTLRGSVVAAALAAGVGCTETRTYTVAVRNDLGRPVTVCLTKAYSPPEDGWESPEEAAGPGHPASDERPPGVVVRPGKTAREGPISGDFYRDRGRAVLRVYSGTPTLTQMNSISRGDLDRLDVDLRPGVNNLVVRLSDSGRMEAVPSAMAREPTDRPTGPGDPGAGD